MRVDVNPDVFQWAAERAGYSQDDLGRKFPKYRDWIRGEVRPTFKQIEAFAKATFVPMGYLFLSQPPLENIPIPDLRTVASRGMDSPSPHMLDTIYLCQRRQTWYRDFAKSMGEPPVSFIGSATLNSSIVETARTMRETLGFDIEMRSSCRTWTEALRRFIQHAEEQGVLVMVSGVVGSNNHRKLDPEEFRGFSLSDEYAPLIFINGADTKAAQMFTLAHELAHLWLGESALTDVGLSTSSSNNIEQWCNAVAAEYLVPIESLQEMLPSTDPLDEIESLTRHFKVSSLVIIRRIYDANRINYETFQEVYSNELQRLMEMPGSSGGDFYLTQSARFGKRFSRAIIISALEGQTLFRDAFQMLGIKKENTFRELGRKLEVMV